MARSRKKKRGGSTPLQSKLTSRLPGRGFLAATAARRRKKAPAREPISEELRDRLREVLSLALFGITLFMLLASLSFGRADNLCGPTGEILAGGLLLNFGYASYLLIFVLGVWSVLLFARLESDSISLRISGLVLCLICFSALLAHLAPDSHGVFPSGGMVGEYINELLVHVAGLGVAGTRIVLIVLSLMTFMLATDVAYYATLVSSASWVREKRAEWVAEKAAVAKARRKAEKAVSVATSEDAQTKRSLWSRFVRNKDAEERAAREDADAIDAELARTSTTKRRKPKRKAADEDDDLELVDDDPEAFEDEDEYEEEEEDEEEYEDGEEEEEDEDEEGDEEFDDEDEELEDPEAELDEDEEELEDDEELEGDEEYEDEEEDVELEADEDDDEEEDEEDEEEEEDPDDLELDDFDEEDFEGAVVRTHMAPIDLTGGGDEEGDLAEPAPQLPGEYFFPSEDLLADQEEVDQVELDELLAEKTEVLEKTLASFKVEARCVEIQKGPVISMFEMELGAGIKVEKVRSLEDDLAIALRARTVRIVAPIPGKNTIGIEVPNPIRETVRLKPLLRSEEFADGTFALPIFLGRDASGRPMIVDLAKMPHLLVAGATGSGKSVCLNTIIVSLLYTRTPEQVSLVLIDPKMVELSQFSSAPHLACPVVSDMKRAPAILEWAVNKMEERYRLLSTAGVRNIYSYNKMGKEGMRERFGDRVDEEGFPVTLPFIVIMVDELADLMMTAAKDVESSITRLAAKSRAVGIHIILATQRPSTNVITGLIKANLPTRVAFMVSSKIDSRVILDVNGAEQLLGQGDMLFLPPHSSHVLRGQCTFLSEEEVRDVMKAVKTESGPHYERELVQRQGEGSSRDPSEVDELYDAAVRFIIATERGSASLLQRKFAIGYTRASRLIDLMAEEGVLGEYKGSQAREVILSLDDWIAINPEARENEEEAY